MILLPVYSLARSMDKSCDSSLKEAEKFLSNHIVHPIPMFKMENPRSGAITWNAQDHPADFWQRQIPMSHFMTHAGALCFLQKGDRVYFG